MSRSGLTGAKKEKKKVQTYFEITNLLKMQLTNAYLINLFLLNLNNKNIVTLLT